MANPTFTIRMRPEDQETLNQIADLRRQTVSDLARQMILEGIQRALDPNEIDRIIEEERERLQQAALEVRKRVGLPLVDADTDTDPASTETGAMPSTNPESTKGEAVSD